MKNLILTSFILFTTISFGMQTDIKKYLKRNTVKNLNLMLKKEITWQEAITKSLKLKKISKEFECSEEDIQFIIQNFNPKTTFKTIKLFNFLAKYSYHIQGSIVTANVLFCSWILGHAFAHNFMELLEFQSPTITIPLIVGILFLMYKSCKALDYKDPAKSKTKETLIALLWEIAEAIIDFESELGSA